MSLLLLLVVLGLIGGYLSSWVARDWLTDRPRDANVYLCLTTLCAGSVACSTSLLVGLSKPEVLVCILVTGVATGWAFLATCCKMRSEVVLALEMAPEVMKYGMANFEIFDSDKNGLWGLSDLDRQLVGGKLPEAEIMIIEYMRSRLAEIGHVTGVEPAVISGGLYDVGAMMLVNLPVYEVSKDDLQSYPGRVRQRYRMW